MPLPFPAFLPVPRSNPWPLSFGQWPLAADDRINHSRKWLSFPAATETRSFAISGGDGGVNVPLPTPRHFLLISTATTSFSSPIFSNWCKKWRIFGVARTAMGFPHWLMNDELLRKWPDPMLIKHALPAAGGRLPQTLARAQFAECGDKRGVNFSGRTANKEWTWVRSPRGFWCDLSSCRS